MDAERLAGNVDKEISYAIQFSKREREKHIEHEMRSAVRNDLRQAIKWCKGDRPRKMAAIESKDGSATSNLREMDRILRENWKSILELYDDREGEPDYDPFKRVYAKQIKKYDMPVVDLCGSRIREYLEKKDKYLLWSGRMDI